MNEDWVIKDHGKLPHNTHGEWWYNSDVSEQVWMWSNQVTSTLENTPLEQLKQSNHPRAQALITWIELSDKNREWYLKNVWTNFNLVEGWFEVQWVVWELDERSVEENPEKWIWNKEWYTYFSNQAKDENFSIWELPTNDEYDALIGILPIFYREEFIKNILWFKPLGFYEINKWEKIGYYIIYWTSTKEGWKNHVIIYANGGFINSKENVLDTDFPVAIPIRCIIKRNK